jgi:hypothetical protein
MLHTEWDRRQDDKWEADLALNSVHLGQLLSCALRIPVSDICTRFTCLFVTLMQSESRSIGYRRDSEVEADWTGALLNTSQGFAVRQACCLALLC